MSYILDALKKSDQQRQLGTTPTLQDVQVTLAAPKRQSLFYYSLLAILLSGAGGVIGFLRPWQAEKMPAGSKPIAQEPPVMIAQQAAPATSATSPEIPDYAVQNVPAQIAAAPNTSIPPAPIAAAPNAAADNQQKPTSHDEIAQEEHVQQLSALPPAIQQQIPDMTIQLHAYASDPEKRLVSINSRLLGEGGYLAPGLKLEQITPNGMIFSYNGYRFQRGIR